MSITKEDKIRSLFRQWGVKLGGPGERDALKFYRGLWFGKRTCRSLPTAGKGEGKKKLGGTNNSKNSGDGAGVGGEWMFNPRIGLCSQQRMRKELSRFRHSPKQAHVGKIGGKEKGCYRVATGAGTEKRQLPNMLVEGGRIKAERRTSRGLRSIKAWGMSNSTETR